MNATEEILKRTDERAMRFFQRELEEIDLAIPNNGPGVLPGNRIHTCRYSPNLTLVAFAM